MRNRFGEVENCLATLLVHVKIESKATGQEKYHPKNDLQFIKKNYQDLLKVKEDKIKSKIYLNLISKGSKNLKRYFEYSNCWQKSLIEVIRHNIAV